MRSLRSTVLARLRGKESKDAREAFGCILRMLDRDRAALFEAEQGLFEAVQHMSGASRIYIATYHSQSFKACERIRNNEPA